MDDLDERSPDEVGAGSDRLTLIRLYNGRGDHWITARFRADLTGIHLADAMQCLTEYAKPLYGLDDLRLLLREAHRLEVDVMPTEDACLTLEDVTKAGSYLVYHVGADMREQAVAWLDAEAAMAEPDFMDGPEPDPGAKSAASVTSVGSTEPGDESEAYADDPSLDEKLF